MNTETYQKLGFNELMTRLSENCVSNVAKEKAQEGHIYRTKKSIAHKLAETSEARTILNSGQNLPLAGVSHIDQLIGKIDRGQELMPQELTLIADFLRSTRRVKQFMEKNEHVAPILMGYSGSIESFMDVEDEIYAAIRNGEVVNEASRALRKVRKAILDTQEKISERLEKFMKNSQNRKYIQEFFVSKKNDRYTVPIKASFQKFVPGAIVESSGKGTTVFIEPEAVRKLNDELVGLYAWESAEVYQILMTLTGSIIEKLDGIKHNKDVIAEFDFIFAKGKLSRQMEGISPSINENGIIRLKNARHPFLLGTDHVPLQFEIGENYRSLVITGPNAGGKTVVLKTIGLLTLMMMAGLHIPADEGAEMAIFDGVFVDIGDNQSIENALSTFSSHMRNIADIVSRTNKQTLLLLDEIGSGTEPNEGAALAVAILEACYKKGATTIATTHYAEIKKYGSEHPDFMNARMAFNQETLEPKYQLIIGESGESNALFIAKKMNLDDKIIRQASRYMTSKDYVYEKITVRKVEQDVREPQIEFAKGDRVELLETKEVGLVYAQDKDDVTVFAGGKQVVVRAKRLARLAKASDLYPADYDLDSLFTSFAERKEARDFERGSKKALRKVQKEIKRTIDND
ncbi:endonuclease MutS2 [Listeria sp. ILCC792]|uniref:endonuclease MutS2 n=1 Tax=Listeria sp. ILCC792 TaxID=1918331 RepID=UPI000B59112A|nr:mannonate oxidoreductase [Listeria sp. ILCC792]